MARRADDLLADLDLLSTEEQPAARAPTKPLTSRPKKSVDAKQEDDDVLAELQAQLAAKPAGASRPTTPRMVSGTARPADLTPASSGPPSGRPSGEGVRRPQQPPSSVPVPQVQIRDAEKKEESAAPPAQAQAQAPAASGGGWWGSMYSAATAAVKQAETLAKDIRSNEDAQKWADQVRGNLNLKGLQNLSTDLRSRAIPTFTSLMEHIAPPISAHERLQIHLTHDILHYPSLDPLIYSTFSRIMSQVEGGDLVVLQRGSENRPRAGSDQQGYRGGILGSGNGWTDGPWWREDHVKRDLSVVPGLAEGSRLARVSAESYAKEFFDARGGVEEAAKKATESLSESNPVRSSDIFLALQAISHKPSPDYFAADARAAEDKKATGFVGPDSDDETDELVTFAIYLHDPLHSLSFSAFSQPFPAKWAAWLDASNAPTVKGETDGLPESIREIINSGGLDPREWVAEWMEEILTLGVGVVAQKYVARRMGVGEGGLGRGKKRVEEDGIGGEAARAI